MSDFTLTRSYRVGFFSGWAQINAAEMYRALLPMITTRLVRERGSKNTHDSCAADKWLSFGSALHKTRAAFNDRNDISGLNPFLRRTLHDQFADWS